MPDVVNDATTAAFIAALADAGQDCRSQLAWLRDWAEGLNAASK